MVFVLSVSVFLGAFISRRKYVLAIAAVFVLYSYSFDVLGMMGEGSILENIRVISFFAYFDSTGVMQYGLSPVNMTGLLGLALILTVSSLWVFERRDVGT